MTPTDNNLETKITLESGGSVVDEDAPFHVLVLGNWSGKGQKNLDLAKRRPIEIDRDNFDAVIRKLGVNLQLDFQENGANILSIGFTEFDDFHPDNLFRQLPIFENLRDLRRKLKDSDTFNEAAREVRSWFPVEAKEVPNEEIAASTPIDADNLLDQILSGKAVEASAVRRKTTESSELSDFIGAIVKPHIVRTDLVEQANLLMVVDEVISDLMRQILHHTDFKALEAAWRGVYFLVRKMETDTDLKVYLFDLTKEELTDDLKSVSSLSDSIYYQWTIGESLETTIGEPWAVVCGNYGFSAKVEDIATLMRIAQIGNAANTPFISHICPDLLGVKSLAESPSSGSWNISENSVEWKLWMALRDKKESEYLGMAMPRFLARLPYGNDTDPTEAFAFEEFTTSISHDNYVWINPSFACAYLLSKSFRKNGWEMADNIGREIDGLPLHVYQVEGETKYKPCAEIPMTEAGCQKMIDSGLIPLVSFRDSDRVRVASFQAIALSEVRIRGRWF